MRLCYTLAASSFARGGSREPLFPTSLLQIGWVSAFSLGAVGQVECVSRHPYGGASLIGPSDVTTRTGGLASSSRAPSSPTDLRLLARNLVDEDLWPGVAPFAVAAERAGRVNSLRPLPVIGDGTVEGALRRRRGRRRRSLPCLMGSVSVYASSPRPSHPAWLRHAQLARIAWPKEGRAAVRGTASRYIARLRRSYWASSLSRPSGQRQLRWDSRWRRREVLGTVNLWDHVREKRTGPLTTSTYPVEVGVSRELALDLGRPSQSSSAGQITSHGPGLRVATASSSRETPSAPRQGPLTTSAWCRAAKGPYAPIHLSSLVSRRSAQRGIEASSLTIGGFRGPILFMEDCIGIQRVDVICLPPVLRMFWLALAELGAGRARSFRCRRTRSNLRLPYPFTSIPVSA